MSEMKGTSVVTVRSPSSYDDQKVVPARDRAFESEPFLVVSGHPYVPKYWAKGVSRTDMTGAHVTTRDDPTEVEMEAHSRFIASGFENMSGVWRPYLTSGVDYLWTSPPDLAPNVDDVEYRIGKELLSRPGLRFNQGDYLVSSFNNGADDAAAFTIAMVLTPLVPLGYTIVSTMDDQDELSVSTGNSGITMRYGASQVSVPVSKFVNTTPCFLLVSSDGGTATMMVGTSTRNMVTRSLRKPEVNVQRMKFLLGKTHLGKAQASMQLFDLSIYDHTLTTSEVYRVVSRYASTYGAV